jgi:hypothetical protein
MMSDEKTTAIEPLTPMDQVVREEAASFNKDGSAGSAEHLSDHLESTVTDLSRENEGKSPVHEKCAEAIPGELPGKPEAPVRQSRGRARPVSATSMDHVQFARRLLLLLFTVTLVGFWIELAWYWAHTLDPATGRPINLLNLRATPAQVRALASSLSGAYGTMIAMLLTFVSLAIPLTANLYTPKLIGLFIRDPINLFVICMGVMLAAHNLLAVSISFDQWTAQLPFAVAVLGAIVGWLLVLPYYFYVVSFIDPHTLIHRVHRALMRELDLAAAGRRSVADSQHAVDQHLHGLASVLLRAADRADRDVTLDAVRTHLLELGRVRQLKARLPPAFLRVDKTLLPGMADDAAEILNEKGIWMEYRIAHQLVLAFHCVLAKMPDSVSAMAQALESAAHQEAQASNTEVFLLLVRTLNSLLRATIKKHDSAAVCDVLYSYKALVRRLLDGHAHFVSALVEHLGYYADYARRQDLPFIYERISYELCELIELADRCAQDTAAALLDNVLNMPDADRYPGLVKSRAVLGAYFSMQGRAAAFERVLRSLQTLSPMLLAQARADILAVSERLFWEVNDHGVNFDYVEPERRKQVASLLERAGAAPGPELGVWSRDVV